MADNLSISQLVSQTEYGNTGYVSISQLVAQVEYIQGIFITQLLAQAEYQPDPVVIITQALAQVERTLFFGYVHTPGGGIDTTLQTKDGTGGDITGIFKRKNTLYFWYDADTGGNDLTVTFYVDGELQTNTVTINTSTRTRGRVALPNWEGYRFAFKLSASDIASGGMKIYSPWHIVYQPFGE